MEKIIITGASGMLGSSLIRELVKKNIQKIVAIVRPKSNKIGNILKHPKVQVLECDANEISSLREEIDGEFEYFFHFAWQGVSAGARDDVYLQLNDVANTLAAIELAKDLGCKKFIGAGSQAELGLVNEKIGSNAIGRPIIAYGVAKAAAGRLGRILAEQMGIEFNWAHILSVYGANDNEYTLIMSLINKLLKGESCDLTSGEQIWDYLYCDDAARALLAIAEHGVNGKTYPVGSGVGRRLKDYVLDIYSAVNNTKAKLNFGAIPTNDKSVKYLCADIDDLKKDTGFTPQVDFYDGINRILTQLKRV